MSNELEPKKTTELALHGQYGEAVKLAQLMAKASVSLPEHLHNKPAECLAIVMMALSWNMNPYMVGQKTSIIKGRLMYEGQLVHAVINGSGILADRLRYDFSGSGENRKCKCTGRIKGEADAREVEIGMPGPNEARNSPLWKTDPDQQLTYKATRIWARRHTPELMLGVYTPEDDWTDAEPEKMREKNVQAVQNRLSRLSSVDVDFNVNDVPRETIVTFPQTDAELRTVICARCDGKGILEWNDPATMESGTEPCPDCGVK